MGTRLFFESRHTKKKGKYGNEVYESRGLSGRRFTKGPAGRAANEEAFRGGGPGVRTLAGWKRCDTADWKSALRGGGSPAAEIGGGVGKADEAGFAREEEHHHRDWPAVPCGEDRP